MPRQLISIGSILDSASLVKNAVIAYERLVNGGL